MAEMLSPVSKGPIEVQNNLVVVVM